MSLLNAFAFFGAMLIFALSPGPGIFAIVSKTLNEGFKNASALLLGIVLGDLIFLLTAIYGLSFIMETLGDFFVFVQYACASYLFYLSYKIFTAPLSLQKYKQTSTNGYFIDFFTGTLIALSNPKVIAFYLGFLPAFVDLKTLSTPDVLLISSIVILTLLVSLGLYATLAHKATEFFTNKNAREMLHRISAIIIASVGLVLILKNY